MVVFDVEPMHVTVVSVFEDSEQVLFVGLTLLSAVIPTSTPAATVVPSTVVPILSTSSPLV